MKYWFWLIEVFAIITGAIFPILFIVFGDITDVLTQREANPFMSDEVFMDGIIQVSRDGLNSSMEFVTRSTWRSKLWAQITELLTFWLKNLILFLQKVFNLVLFQAVWQMSAIGERQLENHQKTVTQYKRWGDLGCSLHFCGLSQLHSWETGLFKYNLQIIKAKPSNKWKDWAQVLRIRTKFFEAVLKQVRNQILKIF